MEEKQVNYWKNANRVYYQNRDEPTKTIFSTAFPESNSFPNKLQYGKQCDNHNLRLSKYQVHISNQNKQGLNSFWKGSHSSIITHI